VVATHFLVLFSPSFFSFFFLFLVATHHILLSFLHTYLHISPFSHIYFFFFVRSLFNGMEWNLGPECGLGRQARGFLCTGLILRPKHRWLSFWGFQAGRAGKEKLVNMAPAGYRRLLITKAFSLIKSSISRTAFSHSTFSQTGAKFF